jgi:RNA polymerase-binding transcription factor DksA
MRHDPIDPATVRGVERAPATVSDAFVARARLDSRTYGICERCRITIPLGRLRALPTTQVCVGCQARAEAGKPAA